MTVDRIEEVQEGNPRHAKLKAKANKGETPPFWVTRGGLLRKSITSETR